MVDLHCHILPGIDDGAKTIEDSLEMARLAVSEGITEIVATPHHKNGRFENPHQDILLKVDELNTRLEQEGIALKILPGQEPAIGGELLEDFENKTLVPLNKQNHLFVEFPSSHVPRYSRQLLFDLQLKGVTPVIVHPERNQEIHERPELLYDFVKRGALAQLTASSLAGKFGKKVRTFSEQLIEANLVHFLASDAHNTSSRAFHLAAAYEVVEDRYGIDLVYQFQDNAELAVDGLNVYREEPRPVKKKKFLGIF